MFFAKQPGDEAGDRRVSHRVSGGLRFGESEDSPDQAVLSDQIVVELHQHAESPAVVTGGEVGADADGGRHGVVAAGRDGVQTMPRADQQPLDGPELRVATALSSRDSTLIDLRAPTAGAG